MFVREILRYTDEILIERSMTPEEVLTTYRNKLIAAGYDQDGRNPEGIVRAFTTIDPTGGKLVQWMMLRFLARDFTLEELPRVGAALTGFVDHIVKSQQKGLGGIQQYRTLNDLETAVEIASNPPPSVKQQRKVAKLEGAEKVFESPEVTILRINTEEASCLYGKGTKWCVSGTNDNMFDGFTRWGPLYLLLTRDKRKFMIHVERNQSQDEQNQYVSPKELGQRYPTLMPWFRHLGEKAHNGEVWYLRHVAVGDAELLPEKIRTNLLRDPSRIIDSLLISKQNYDGEGVRSLMLTDPSAAAAYAVRVLKRRWTEAEPIIATDPSSAIGYAEYFDMPRWKEAEPAILASPNMIERYARYVIKGRWPEGEEVVLKDPAIAVEYASRVIRGRWPEGEKVIMKDPMSAMNYARQVLNDKWPEGEKAIMKDPEAIFRYVVTVLFDRWKEAEPMLKTDLKWWKAYKDEMATQYGIRVR